MPPIDYMPMHTLVKPGERGTVKVDHFTITKEAADDYNFGTILSFTPFMRVEPGRYARLTVGRRVDDDGHAHGAAQQ